MVKLYTLMIVEDEPLIRAGLLKYFNWEELGFTVIIEAEDGMDASDKAKKYTPDFIITDIRMPKMDGLQLIDQLRLELPDCIFVILSGYEDFAYAKQAIQLGVTAYLLKPLQFEESLETIQECVTKMKTRLLERNQQLEIKKALEETEALKQETYIKELIENDFSEQEWIRRCKSYKLPIILDRYMTIVFSTVPENLLNYSSLLPQWEVIADTIRTFWKQMSLETSECRILSYTSGMKLYLLISYSESSQLTVSSLARDVVNRCGQISDSIYCGIGPVVRSCTSIRESKLLAEKAIHYRFFRKDVHIFDTSQLENVKGYPFQLTENHKLLLLQAIEQAELNKIKELMKQFEQEVINHASQATPDKLFAFIQEMIGVCLRFVHKHGIDMKDIYHTKLFSFTFLDDFRSLDALFQWLGDFIFMIGINYKDHSEPVENRIFSKIEAYILENMDKDITLTMVADIFFYNPAYLSRLFKNKLNKNYTTFITEIRINYAKECLKQPAISVTEVGIMCGYQSYKHFVKTFKKITGRTPTDYRKRLGEVG